MRVNGVNILFPTAQLLKKNGPHPMILQPHNGGFWIDGLDLDPSAVDEVTADLCPFASDRLVLEYDDTNEMYRKHFYGKVNRYRLIDGVFHVFQNSFKIISYLGL